MTPDKDIQELFDSVNISFTDGDAFLSALNQRLEKVEFIKETQDAQIKRYKASVICSLIAGLIAGAGAVAFLQTVPDAVLEKISCVLAGLSMFGIDDQAAILNSAIALLSGTATFMIARNLLDIRLLRNV